MKTAKKLFSLLLVAVLLFSALPFQASATTEPAWEIVFYDQSNKLDTKPMSGGKVTQIATAPAADPGWEFYGWNVNGVEYTEAELKARTFAQGEMAEYKENDVVVAYFIEATAIYRQVHVHDMTGNPVRVEPTCYSKGSITITCKAPLLDGSACTHKTVEELDYIPHNWSEWEEVVAPQIGVAGVEKRECQNDGCEAEETREIPALEAPPAPTYLVEFYDIDGVKIAERNWEMYKTITNADLPLAPEVLNKDFMGWFTSPTSNIELEAGDRFDNYYNKFYARYEDSTHDGQSRINVYFRLYSEGVAQGQARKLTSFQATDYTNLEDALDARMGQFSDMLEGVVDMNMYQVADGYYVYNPSTGEQTSLSSSAKVNGDTSIIIRLDANRSARATVMVFVHKKVDAAAAYTYTMSGYTVNDTVFESDVETLLKSKGSNYTINGMYSDLMWERKNDGYTTNPVDTLSIEEDGENGVLKIHVLAEKFAPTGTTTSKPASNPATGDAIMATAGIMALSGAAFVTLTQLRKRKMI